jgi:hypothetical protein
MSQPGLIVRAVSFLSVCTALLALSPAAQAAESGFYMGADAVQLTTTIDWGFTESYTTTHARFKAGYQILDFLSVEGRIMSSDYNTDIDVFGDTYRFDTGTMFGVYARPHTNFRDANVYGLIGLTTMNTKYRALRPFPGPVDSDAVLAFTVGVGGTFRIAGNLFLDIEAQAFSGTADYKSYFLDYVDVYGVGISAGLRYRF